MIENITCINNVNDYQNGSRYIWWPSYLEELRNQGIITSEQKEKIISKINWQTDDYSEKEAIANFMVNTDGINKYEIFLHLFNFRNSLVLKKYVKTHFFSSSEKPVNSFLLLEIIKNCNTVEIYDVAVEAIEEKFTLETIERICFAETVEDSIAIKSQANANLYTRISEIKRNLYDQFYETLSNSRKSTERAKKSLRLYEYEAELNKIAINEQNQPIFELINSIVNSDYYEPKYGKYKNISMVVFCVRKSFEHGSVNLLSSKHIDFSGLYDNYISEEIAKKLVLKQKKL